MSNKLIKEIVLVLYLVLQSVMGHAQQVVPDIHLVGIYYSSDADLRFAALKVDGQEYWLNQGSEIGDTNYMVSTISHDYIEIEDTSTIHKLFFNLSESSNNLLSKTKTDRAPVADFAVKPAQLAHARFVDESGWVTRLPRNDKSEFDIMAGELGLNETEKVEALKNYTTTPKVHKSNLEILNWELNN